MKELKYFNQLNEYTTDKGNFTYPTLSYVEENKEVYYKEKPIEFIILHFEIKNEEQLQEINEASASMGYKLPLLMRSDLIAEAKLNEQDITDKLHKGEPHVFTGTTAQDKMQEFVSLVMNESGLTEYVISVDGPFEVGNSWDLEIKFKESITDCIGLFYHSIALTEIPADIFNNCTEITDFSYTFSFCSGLTSIPENLFKYNTAVTNFSQTFSGCTGLTGNVPTDTDGTPIYNRSGEGKDGYAIVTYYTDCFRNCTGLTDYSSIPLGWKMLPPN